MTCARRARRAAGSVTTSFRARPHAGSIHRHPIQANRLRVSSAMSRSCHSWAWSTRPEASHSPCHWACVTRIVPRAESEARARAASGGSSRHMVSFMPTQPPGRVTRTHSEIARCLSATKASTDSTSTQSNRPGGKGRSSTSAIWVLTRCDTRSRRARIRVHSSICSEMSTATTRQRRVLARWAGPPRFRCRRRGRRCPPGPGTTRAGGPWRGSRRCAW